MTDTKTELLEKMGSGFAQVNQRLETLEEKVSDLEKTKADKSDLVNLASKEDTNALKEDINELTDHLTTLLTKYMENHGKTHEEIKGRLVKLEATSN